MQPITKMFNQRVIKRIFDICCAMAGLIILSPVFIVVSTILLFTISRPIFFTQIRPGLNKTPFKIIKFRSMKTVVDANNKELSDGKRLTKFGGLMRDLSIDELPQLINVLKGEMSIVGPRPLLYDFFPYYTKQEMRRHEMQPGITGLAQVNGRNNLNWDDRLQMDVEYIDNWSLWLDMKIIFKTILVVVKRDGVKTEGYETFLRLDEYRKTIEPSGINRMVS